MRYPFPLKTEKVNNNNFELIGVEHTPEFYRRHDSFFEEKIQNSELVILEANLFLESKEENSFYSFIANQAEKNNLPIYTLDSTENVAALESSQMYLGFALALLANTGLKFSRRKVLSALLGMVSLDLMISVAPIGAIRELGQKENIEMDNIISYSTMLDYRDILCASNLEKLERRVKSQKPIPYFIGAGHINGIQMYLRSNTLRKKRILYALQDEIIDTTIKKYVKKDGNIYVKKM